MSKQTAKQTTDTKKELPAGWQWVRLREVAEVVNGFGFTEFLQGRVDLPYPFIKVSDMNAPGSEVVIDTAANTVDDEILRHLGARLYPRGTVVFPKVGGALLTNKKRVLGRESSFDNNIMGVVPKSADSEYLFFWLCTVDLASHANTQALPSIRQSLVASFLVPLPPLSEQRRIAGVLKEQMAAVVKARAAAEIRLETIKVLPMAYYHQVLGTTIPFAATPLVPKEPTRPGWRWYRLTDLARLATGHTPSRYRPEYWKGEIPWIQLADVRALDGREAFDTSEYTNELGIQNSAAVILPKGTVCMSRTASVGFFTIMGRQMATSQDFVNWVCGPELDPWLLMHLLIASRKQIQALGSGAVHNTIYFPTVQAFSICVPPLSQQKRIAASLSNQMTTIEGACAAAKSELETINDLPAVLLRRAFNGEI